MQSFQKGFTLIELVIVVAIVGILAAIAYPSYQANVQNSRRADAKNALMQFAQAMERYYGVNYTYEGAADGGADTGAPSAALFSSKVPIDGAQTFYDLTIDSATRQEYELKATPVGVQAGDRCGELTINQAGTKTASGGGLDECWL